MKRVEKLEDEAIYLWAREIIRIGNIAVKEAIEENKKYGIPEIIYRNGKVYYILESGEITTERPDVLK